MTNDRSGPQDVIVELLHTGHVNIGRLQSVRTPATTFSEQLFETKPSDPVGFFLFKNINKLAAHFQSSPHRSAISGSKILLGGRIQLDLLSLAIVKKKPDTRGRGCEAGACRGLRQNTLLLTYDTFKRILVEWPTR